MSSDLPAFLARLRRHTDLPLAVGFGISTVAQAAAVAEHADGVIVGSRLVEMIRASLESSGCIEGGKAEARSFLEEAKAAIAVARAAGGLLS
jgi:tryptophan synthase alpha chain